MNNISRNTIEIGPPEHIVSILIESGHKKAFWKQLIPFTRTPAAFPKLRSSKQKMNCQEQALSTRLFPVRVFKRSLSDIFQREHLPKEHISGHLKRSWQVYVISTEKPESFLQQETFAAKIIYRQLKQFIVTWDANSVRYACRRKGCCKRRIPKVKIQIQCRMAWQIHQRKQIPRRKVKVLGCVWVKCNRKESCYVQ